MDDNKLNDQQINNKNSNKQATNNINNTRNKPNDDNKNNGGQNVKTTIKIFEDILDKYYAKYNKTYKDNNGIGKFTKYWNDQGFDEDQFHEEIAASVDNCLVIDFDTDFPFGNPHKPQKATKRDIYDICRKIYNGGCKTNISALIGVPTVAWRLGKTFNIDKLQMEKIKAIFNKTCPKIYASGFINEPGLMRACAVSHLNYYPYLQFIMDMWGRQRVTNKLVGIQRIREQSAYEWAIGNPHINSLKKIQIPFLPNKYQPFTTICDALKSYPNRIIPNFKFTSPTLINDSIKDVVEYIYVMTDFVQHLIKQKEKTCPFQFDLCFVFNDTIQNHQIVSNDDDHMHDDDDDDIDDDPDINDKPKGVQQSANDFYDCIGNIKEKIKLNKLFHTIETVANDDYGFTFVRQKWEHEFQRKIVLKKYKLDYGINSINQYPRNKRFCAIIDRRDPHSMNFQNIKTNNNKTQQVPLNKGTIDNDEIIFFEPPDNCNKLPAPNDMVSEWYFNSTKTCIVPTVNNNNQSTFSDKDLTPQQKLLKEAITSTSHCNGALMILSFHAISSDELRCYLYRNGTVIRFFPIDIIKLFPNMFVQTDANVHYINNGQALKRITKIKPFLDFKFDNFYNKYSGQRVNWHHAYKPHDNTMVDID